MYTRYFILVGIFAVFLAGGFFFMKEQPAPEINDQKSVDLEQYTSETYGLSFAYPSSYVLSEMDAEGSGMRLHHIITLMRKADLPLPVNGEGPPSITIEVYQNNLDEQTTEEWIKNTSASNFKLGEGRLASTTISGLPALSYRWSGLYEGTTIALAQEHWVYALTVTYLEMGAPIIQDFVVIRDSVRISPKMERANGAVGIE